MNEFSLFFTENNLIPKNDAIYKKEETFDFLSNEEVNAMSPDDYEAYLDRLFKWYREEFHFTWLTEINKSRKNKVFRMLKKHKEYKSFDKDYNLTPNNMGCSLADSYFPHKIEVKSVGYKTIPEAIADDKIFRKVLHKSFKYFQGKGTPYDVRQIIKFAANVQMVSNFRPTSAKAVYKRYLPKEGGKVWDMSAGWGGRLFGALASDVVKEYHATEPSSLTVKGLNEIIKEFDTTKKAKIFMQGSETFKGKDKENYYDLCFTSPPYFNTEMYADEETQSWKSFATKEDWKENFLRETLRNCYNNLKDERYCVINIANVKTYKNLVADTIQVGIEEGFDFIEEKFYLISRLPGGNVNKKVIKLKGEPLLVFYKGKNRWVNELKPEPIQIEVTE
jgi:DNA modification methylase